VEGNLYQQAVKWKFSLLSGIRECHPRITAPLDDALYKVASFETCLPYELALRDEGYG